MEASRSTAITIGPTDEKEHALNAFVDHPLRATAIKLFGKRVRYYQQSSIGGAMLRQIGIVFGVDPRPLGRNDGCYLCIRPDGELLTTHHVDLEAAIQGTIEVSGKLQPLLEVID